MALPTDGWWIDVDHFHSLAALTEILTELLGASELARLGVANGLDLSHVTGPNREPTT